MNEFNFLSNVKITLKDDDEKIRLDIRRYDKKFSKESFEEVNLSNGEGYHYIINRGPHTLVERVNVRTYNSFHDVMKEVKKIIIKNNKNNFKVFLKYRDVLYSLFSVNIHGSDYISYWGMCNYYFDYVKNYNVGTNIELFSSFYDTLDESHNYIEKNISVESKNLFDFYNSVLIKPKKPSAKLSEKKESRDLKIENDLKILKSLNINRVILNNYDSYKIYSFNLDRLLESVVKLNKVFNTSKFNYVDSVLFNSSKVNSGTYSLFLKRITISKAVNVKNFNATYFHEYGHHIYYEMYNNPEVVEKFIPWYYGMLKKETLSKILKKFSDRDINSKNLPKRVRYLLSEEEVFARLFEQLTVYKLGDELPNKSNWYFSEEELKEFSIFLSDIIELYLNNKKRKEEN